MKYSNDLLNEREERYGCFSDQAELIHGFHEAINEHPNGWDILDSVQAEAIRQIITKIARIINGDPCYRDNWDDISGYAQLASESTGNLELLFCSDDDSGGEWGAFFEYGDELVDDYVVGNNLEPEMDNANFTEIASDAVLFDLRDDLSKRAR